MNQQLNQQATRAAASSETLGEFFDEVPDDAETVTISRSQFVTMQETTRVLLGLVLDARPLLRFAKPAVATGESGTWRAERSAWAKIADPIAAGFDELAKARGFVRKI